MPKAFLEKSVSSFATSLYALAKSNSLAVHLRRTIDSSEVESKLATSCGSFSDWKHSDKVSNSFSKLTVKAGLVMLFFTW